MKLDIKLYTPELAEVVESNEAHIRLMSGTWIAIKHSLWLVIPGLGLCFAALLISYVLEIGAHVEIEEAARNEFPPYLVYFLVSGFLLGSMLWAKWRIEKLFHYRRVNELFYIVQSAHIADLAKKKIETAENSTTTPDVS